MKSIADQMSFYEAYHKNPWNKATHFIGIPSIIFSILIPMGWISVEIGGYGITAAMVFVAIVLAYYYALDAALAIGMTLFIVPVLYAAHLAAQWPYGAGMALFLIFFVGGWIFQLIGHGMFEKRRPALTDNLFQMFIGPIFMVAEVYFLLGFKQELHAEVKRLEAASRGVAEGVPAGK